MEYQELYKTQLQEIQDLKSQINILETILRNFIPTIEKKEDNKNGKFISTQNRSN